MPLVLQDPDTRPCRKVAYPSRAKALLAMDGIRIVRARQKAQGNPHGTRPPECAAYLCPRCRLWHLTSQQQPRGS